MNLSAPSAFVKVENLAKRFGDLAAVDGVSLEVTERSTVALLGPSGCGKTTILRCLAGLETPDRGFIEIGGTVVFDQGRRVNLMPEARGLGIVFQSYAVWPHMSVADNVGFPLRVRGVAKSVQRERVGRILEMVGLAGAIDKPATALSGGQQQRVALARALVHEPRLVLFDEPMSNLDAQLREQVRMELKLLQQRLGFTAIYVTHDQAEAFALAEKVVVMNRGRIDTVGAPRDVFHRPQTAFVARFLGFNVLDAKVVRVGTPEGAPPAAAGAEIALAGGQTLWGRFAAKAGLAAGVRVLACIRKEHVGIRAANGTPAPPGAQIFAAEIRASSFLGLVEEYVVAMAGLELRAIAPDAGLAIGPAEVVIRAEDCIVLPAPD